MRPTANVLVAGAGWRVTAFVVPALRALGIAPDEIHVLRRKDAPLGGPLSGARRVDWGGLAPSYELTINCVSQEALVRVQSRLVDRFPSAIHFCDTPIVARASEIPHAWRLARRARLYSLEDWPSMPNLQPLLGLFAGGRSPATLRFEHIGIDTHFLSVARTARAMGMGQQLRVAIRRRGNVTVRSLDGAVSATRTGAKDYGRAKILAWNGNTILEDFLGVDQREDGMTPSDHPEVVSRELAGDRLRYLRGGVPFAEVVISREMTSSILEEPGRKGVHELDKCVALMRLFRSALEGRPEGYGYIDSIADTCVAWWIGRGKITPAW